MSQQLTPTDGGINPEVQTTITSGRLNVLSTQFIEANNLQSRATEWTEGGRPIYRRLPGTSETYQINFFNLVTESNLTGNTSVRESIEEIGYVYVPWGESINGATSSEVVSAESKQTLLIKAGSLVWKYGKTTTLPTIVDLRTIDARSSKYDIAYQLVYDDSPTQQQYSVSDFALTGQPLNITSSSDGVIGWRYPAENAFLNDAALRWSNEDTFFPSYSQPSSAFIQWESDLPSAYSQIVLRCPSGTSFAGSATLEYAFNGVTTFVQTVDVSSDSSSQFFQFDVEAASFQTGWRVTFSSLEVSIQSVTVSGVLTLQRPSSSPSPRATLVMYPAGTLPKTVTGSNGVETPAVYVTLAQVDVDDNFTIINIDDTRNIIHRDYVPVADWLTKPFDQDLINLYNQVSNYSTLWMAPPSCLTQEYVALSADLISVEA